MPAQTCLGIDLGTSAVRTCLIDDHDNIIELTQQPLPASQHVQGRIVQQPRDWQTAVQACLTDLLSRHDPGAIRAVAVDGTSATVLLCTPDGTPLTPALMYNDASSQLQTTRLADTGIPPGPAMSTTASLPKALQLTGQLAEVLNTATALIQHQADWITGWLRGTYGHSDENNALKLGYDAGKRQWPQWVTETLPENLLLPDVYPPGTNIGTAGPVLRSLGLSAQTRIIAGTTDSTASFLATMAGDTPLDSHTGVTTLGSTLVLKQLCPEPLQDIQAGIYSHRLGDRWLAGGASNSGGAVLAQFFSPEELTRLSQQIDPATDSGLDYYPLPAPGERFPVCDPERPPRLSPHPDNDVQFLHGLLEGIARIEKQGYERLQQLGAPPIRRVITGGGAGAHNATWSRIRERILGVPVTTAGQTEAAFGMARLARRGVGLF